MNFSGRDIAILFSMALCVILMTFSFTALGLTNENVNTTDIPEYNNSGNNFQMVGDFPDSPGQPSAFEMKYNRELQGDSDNQIWVNGDTSDGTELVIIEDNSTGTPKPEIIVNYWNNGVVSSDKYLFSNVDDYTVITNNSYEFYFEFSEIKNENENNEIWVIDVEIRNQPSSDGGFIDRIPVVGGIFSTGEAIASIIGYIGSIIFWISATLLEIAVNMITMLYGIVAFFVEFLNWLISTYTAIVTGVAPWASIILVLPGLLLSFEFTKIILIGIKLLPTT